MEKHILWRSFQAEDFLLQPNDPEAPYMGGLTKTTVHWGQRKLSMALIQFLTIFWEIEKIPNPILLYIGAAPGYNIEFIMKNLFPNFTSYLYDPSPIKVTPTDKMKVINE